MTLTHGFKTAVSGLTSKKSRSALTILGIVIGITSIILIMSLGSGAQNLILSQVQGLGANTVTVQPGRQAKGPSDFGQLFSDSLKEKDLTALQRKENAPTITDIMPEVITAAATEYEGTTYRSTLLGATDLVTKILNVYPNEGEFFTQQDVNGKASVAVIGQTVRENLFGQSQAVGQAVKINGKNFRIVGVLPKQGSGLVSVDDLVLIPYTTAQQYITGTKYYNRLIVRADSEANVPQTVHDIQTTLRISHNITDPSKDDFNVETQQNLVNTLSTITNALTAFLVAVAAISLLVGGIGIMNIMLVSVTERTREIGLRKALGATGKDILTQFLLESILLTITGGIIGITLGATFSFLVSIIISKVMGLNWQFVFPISAPILGVGVAASVGLIFGLYPAKQAAKKSPIEALRYE